jgi:hypothetical protein
MMEAARTSETLVNFYQTTRCYNPEDSHQMSVKLLGHLSVSKYLKSLDKKIAAVLWNSVGITKFRYWALRKNPTGSGPHRHNDFS